MKSILTFNLFGEKKEPIIIGSPGCRESSQQPVYAPFGAFCNFSIQLNNDILQATQPN